MTIVDLWVEVENKNDVERRSGSRLLLSGLFLFVRENTQKNTVRSHENSQKIYIVSYVLAWPYLTRVCDNQNEGKGNLLEYWISAELYEVLLIITLVARNSLE